MRPGNSAARWRHRQASARLHRRAASQLPAVEADLDDTTELETLLIRAGLAPSRSWRGLAHAWLTRGST